MGVNTDIVGWSGTKETIDVGLRKTSGSNVQQALRTVTQVVNSAGEIQDTITGGGVVDTSNSTSTPLGADGVFTGEAVDITNNGIVFVNVYSDVASAVDGLSIQQSSDGVNFDHTDDYTLSAGSAKNYSINPHAQFYRVVYTNGGVAQTEFRLQTITKTLNAKPSSHRIKDNISGDDDAVLVKSAITGEDGGGNWRNVKTTEDGNLTMSDNSNGLSIARGLVTGASFVHKFGKAPDFDAGDGFVTLWDGANDADFSGSPSMRYVYSTTADIDTLSSSSAGDTQQVEVQGLDEDYNLVVQTTTLNGQSDVTLTTPLMRVFRLKNVGTSDFAGNVWLRVNGSAQTSGVPNTASSVRLKVANGNNQTLMAIYTVPANMTCYIRKLFAGFSRVTGGLFATPVASEVQLYVRPQGQVFQLKYDNAIISSGTSVLQETYEEPEVVSEKSDIELRANTNTTATSVSGGFDLVLIDN